MAGRRGERENRTILSIVSTPIGNLGDITLRAIETLKACDAVVCEDTRVTGNLLKLLGIPKKELISFHSFNQQQRCSLLVARCASREHLVLVSDAGTPGISDPGYQLVAKILEFQATGQRANEQRILEVIPGPSAFLAALSASGLPINQFLYLGFLPIKKGRQTLLKTLATEEKTIVFYESVHRVERTLNELAEALSAQPLRPVVIARELTKIHEEITHTTVADLPHIASTLTKKGEFVIIIGPQER